MHHIRRYHSQDNLSPNFKACELSCSCGCSYTIISSDLLVLLEEIRRMIGKPIQINSGYRCPAGNQKVGGAGGSRHLAGEAADITWANAAVDLASQDFIDKLRALHHTHRLYGLGIAKTWIHVDVDPSRKTLTSWSYGTNDSG